jgi:8-oxo-dGTP pyrophosphatase MutT (NUDIX family)
MSQRAAALDCLENLSSPIAHEDEAGWRSACLLWLISDEPLCRSDAPALHLCVYFALLDSEDRSVLLVRHRKAKLALPSGGHVEPGEDPTDTVVRECKEELGLDMGDNVWFHPVFGERAVMVTSTNVGTPDDPHVDVTFWFVLQGFHNEVQWSRDELDGVLSVDVDLAGDLEWTDPHWPLFVDKLRPGLLAPLR